MSYYEFESESGTGYGSLETFHTDLAGVRLDGETVESGMT